jgi:hypothetical protein
MIVPMVAPSEHAGEYCKQTFKFYRLDGQTTPVE